MEYVDGQLVGVRDRMANAKATEGKSHSKGQQDVSIVSYSIFVCVLTNSLTHYFFQSHLHL